MKHANRPSRGFSLIEVLIAVVVLSTIGLVAALSLGQGLALLSGNIAAGRYVQDGTAGGDVISVEGIEGTVEELGRCGRRTTWSPT